jgi:hypothetical protein
VIAHDRRRILHCNVTKHPTSLWVVQQLREAFPFGSAPRFLIFDRDRKYGLPDAAFENATIRRQTIEEKGVPTSTASLRSGCA